jgi:hypothetical protein
LLYESTVVLSSARWRPHNPPDVRTRGARASSDLCSAERCAVPTTARARRILPRRSASRQLHRSSARNDAKCSCNLAISLGGAPCASRVPWGRATRRLANAARGVQGDAVSRPTSSLAPDPASGAADPEASFSTASWRIARASHTVEGAAPELLSFASLRSRKLPLSATTTTNAWARPRPSSLVVTACWPAADGDASHRRAACSAAARCAPAWAATQPGSRRAAALP